MSLNPYIAMEKVFKSGVSRGLVGFILTCYSACLVPLFFRDFSWTYIVVTIICISLCYGNIKILSTCSYTISGTRLTVKFFVIYHQRYDIMKMTRIAPTRSIISAPAASLDRLRISMERRESVIVSPKDKKAFVNELIRINPKITLDGIS